MTSVRQPAARLVTGALLGVPCIAVTAAWAEPPDLAPVEQRLDPAERSRVSTQARCPSYVVLSTAPPPGRHGPCYQRWFDLQRYLATLPRFPV